MADKLKIKHLGINEPKPAAYNPRKKLKAGDPEYQKIKRSIEEFGYVDPIIVNADYTVIGGHQRLTVMKDLGFPSLDCVVLDIDKTKEKALNVALNKISGEWDMDALKDVLSGLDEDDQLLTGFDMAELDEMLGDIEKDIKINPEIELGPELFEEYNYVLLFFDNSVDWETAIAKLDLKTVTDKLGEKARKKKDNSPGRSGLGCVIRGDEVLRRLQ